MPEPLVKEGQDEVESLRRKGGFKPNKIILKKPAVQQLYKVSGDALPAHLSIATSTEHNES